MSTKGSKKQAEPRVVVSDTPTPGVTGANKEVLEAYWKRNLRLTLTLLAVWFLVGYVLAIIFAPALNNFTFLGAPLGFWIAQNGAIYVFVLLILIYATRMNRMDEEFDVEEQ